jgi:prepilin-type N-terminal cleavage/methylation domain-containing protein
MKTHSTTRRGFTLMETVIAIGVLAVLLTAFMAVFGPAASGIRKSISAEEADRIVSSYEEELATLRTKGYDINASYHTASGKASTAFEKAYTWIVDSAKTPVMLYQYRADSVKSTRPDGTMSPYAATATSPGIAGKDYVLRTGVRRRDDPEFLKDLAAVEGPVFTALTTQLVFNQKGELIKGTASTIADPVTGAKSGSSDAYTSAVVAFSADFYLLPSTSAAYLKTGGAFNPTNLSKTLPVFSRNLAVRR